ncbi:MAG: hypothetical protein ACQEVA_11130, partial [Myxococcota bacterium]
MEWVRPHSEERRWIYQRINNGASNAGFAGGQAAYERAFDRYFRALDWLEASNLDHARNGYFGRTGNALVPAGPVP